jgi:hypothetical protein
MSAPTGPPVVQVGDLARHEHLELSNTRTSDHQYFGSVSHDEEGRCGSQCVGKVVVISCLAGPASLSPLKVTAERAHGQQR